MKFNLTRTVYWIGPVSEENLKTTLEKISHWVEKEPDEPIHLFICSNGGNLQVAFAFFDIIRTFNPHLVTIACGHVGNATVIVWLAGQQRLVTRHTTLQFPPLENLSEIEHDRTSWERIIQRATYLTKQKGKVSELIRNGGIVEPKEAVTLCLALDRLKT